MASQQQQHHQQQYQQQQPQQYQGQQQPSYGNGNPNPHHIQDSGMASMGDATGSYVTARTMATAQSIAGTVNGNDNATVGTNITGGGGSVTGGGGSVILAQPTPAKHPSFYTTCGCIECYKPSRENLKYNYEYDDINGKKPAQAYPRIRERGEFYIDSFNGEPWSCSFGTAEKNGTWFNSSDQAGSIMSALVWVLMLYSSATVTLLTVTEGIPVTCGMIYNILCFMALACHAKTSLTDPGSVPIAAIPSERQRLLKDSHSMCGQCQTFKPPMSHHCRICNRCISRMDHHCPWMNNCVGGNNLKHFLLFLVYTWTCAAYALALFGWNYFFCADENCTFHPLVVHLVRVMTILCVGAFLFTSSMLMNVCYGLMTGIGTIDRLKKKATNTMNQSDEEPIPLKDVFGIQGWFSWPFPCDPIFEDFDQAMGYCLPQRLDRERQFMEYKRPIPEIQPVPSMELPRCINDLLPV